MYTNGDDTSKHTSLNIGVPFGQYSINVKDNTSSFIGNFSAQVNYTPADNWEKEPNNSKAQSNSIPLNTQINASSHDGYDADFYSFEIKNTTSVKLKGSSTQNPNPSRGGDFIIQILDPSTKTLVSHSHWGNVPVTFETESVVLTPGTYNVKRNDNGSTYMGDYNFTVVTEGSEVNPNPSTPSTGNGGTIYRLYNNKSGEHLYTSDENEYNTLPGAGWTQEGVAWIAPTSGDPVYRLYSPVTGSHLYTRDENEVNTLLRNGAWTADNNRQPIMYSGGSKSVYRLYHEGIRMHLLTTNESEYNTLGGSGWKKEGVALNALS